ncbi:MFS transporter, partial [Klebsiella pneumoniae]
AGVMFTVPFIVNRVGAKNALIFAACISSGKNPMTGYTSSLVFISIIKLMHWAWRLLLSWLQFLNIS